MRQKEINTRMFKDGLIAVFVFFGMACGGSALADEVAYFSMFVLEGGVVTSSDGVIECGDGYIQCENFYDQLTTITLTASPSPGYTWGGWQDETGYATGCDMELSCTYTIDPQINPVSMISALFISQTPSPSMYVEVFGEGTVTDSAGDINCTDFGGSCDIGYDAVTLVSLTATPASGYRFVRWDSTDCGTAVNCDVNVDPQQNPVIVQAVFAAESVAPVAALSVSVNEGGQVTSDDGAIACSDTLFQCSAEYSYATTITLTAAPTEGYAWGGWQGAPDCDMQLSCSYAIDPIADPSPRVSAIFETENVSTFVTVSILGEGSVTDSTGDINCNSDGVGVCDVSYPTATTLSLSATPAAGYHFVGWSGGDCGSSVNCELNVDPSQPVLLVIAEFEAEASPPAPVISETTYTYNALGQRTSKTVNGETTFFVYGTSGELIAELNAQGDTVREYYRHNNEVLAFSQMPGQADEQTLFVHNDHLATPEYVTNNQAEIVWSAERLPFGETIVDEDPDGDFNLVSLPLRFPGQYYDEETGKHYNYFRDYDPSTGRYLQSDPIGLDGGLNTYAYVSGNPLSLVDPQGLSGIIGILGEGAASGLGEGLGAGLPRFDPVPMIMPNDQELQQEIEQEANRREYKNICNQKPPAGLTDPCLRAKWELNKAIMCKKAREENTRKWWGGVDDRHDPQLMNDLDNAIRNAEKAVERHCTC